MNAACPDKNFTSEKELVRAFHRALSENPQKAVGAFLSDDCRWYGFHPFGLLTQKEIAPQFWTPLQKAIRPLQRREEVFFAGENSLPAGGTWVVSMGHLMGLFDSAWLGIPPTQKIVMLRYCEFSRVSQGQITEQAMYFDLPHLMSQTGRNPFPEGTGQNLVQPGPKGGGGILLDDAPRKEGEKTLQAINRMISDLGNWDHPLSLEEELRLSWCEDMLWWGPTGIGSSYTIERYAKQHAGPFRAAFSERKFNGHIARLAEGPFGGFFGWPNFSAVAVKPYLGLAPNGRTVDFRVIDIYRREGDKLAENWIFIDLLYYAYQMGQDILGAQG